MKSVYKTRYNSLHNWYRRCDCCECNYHEEYQSNNISCYSHFIKYLWQWYKHKTRSCWHAVSAHKYIYCRNNHKTCKECNKCIKNLDLVDWTHELWFLLDIRTICNHDSHSHTDWVEQLTECINKYCDKLLHCKPLEVRNHIYLKTLKTTSCCTWCILIIERQWENTDCKNKHNKDRHEHLAEALDTFIDSANDNCCCYKQINHSKYDWCPLACNKACEISIRNCIFTASCNEKCKVF